MRKFAVAILVILAVSAFAVPSALAERGPGGNHPFLSAW